MDILQTHFRTVTTLGAYFGVGMGDEIETARLWVCCSHDIVAPPADPLDQHGFSQTEIVNNAIRSIILHPSSGPNVMTLGFKVLKDGSTSMHGIHGIENSFPNTIVTFLKSFAWQRLLDRLGTSAMMHLLCETSVFSELPNGCFFQITGCPLAELPMTNSEYASDWLKSLQAKRAIEPSAKRKISSESHDSRQKLRKIEEKRADSSILKNNDVIIERYKIFYKRPTYDLSRNMMYGLPKNHMLNRFADEKYIIYLLQRIFPRQFKLPSVFTTSKFQPVMVLSQSKLDSMLEDPITSCEWLVPPNYSKNPPKHIPPNDIQKRKEIFSEFIYWIMTEFVIPVISILKYESAKILDESATVTGMSDVYSKLKLTSLALLKSLFSPDKLYFVKADIVQCFDNINQEMLMDIIKDAIHEEEYLVHKYSKAYANVGKIKKRFCRVAKNSAEFTQFSVLARQLSSALRNVILTDGVLHSFEERDCLLALLEEHICNNLVKMGMKFYKQVRGIPQGSVLSTLLCSLYLSHMEKSKIKNIMSCNDLLLRLVDDFLFITPSKEKAIQFTQLLHEGGRIAINSADLISLVWPLDQYENFKREGGLYTPSWMLYCYNTFV
ncbi:hypothetical protein HDU77_005722 [Chytriomyces hyalinus]|nr:hypothetical protein HDU77_005722 [Chytriomyces hyalinus]